ncbi:uncharacterized protein C8A04DRAFT_36136 [Dichotomopilus funicola]|uniref:Uncharacterized protein n=1 Tax=Dichotomopilus funicola TaxID=1934379 RepID=A0AAN6V519_9PEZI|nr:hypothetical protein C8A04DRAFT_36136 [Dichotomopilus funicola]
MSSPTHAQHGVHPPLNWNSPDDNGGSSRLNPKPDEGMDTQEEREMPQRSYYARVLGTHISVSPIDVPDTYDPDGWVPGTPEPEPYDPETYAAWGRKHLGEEWYQLRKAMLQERNIYLRSDWVYSERRPLRPARHVGMSDEPWKRLWSRLSKVLPRVQPSSTAPLFREAWERLGYARESSRWSEEEYQFNKIFLKEDLIDCARAHHETQEGDIQREKEREEIAKVRYEPGTLIESDEYERRMTDFRLRREGWVQEQFDARDRAAVAKAQKRGPELERELNTPPKTQEEMNLRFRLCDLQKISREEQDRLARMYGFFERPPINPPFFGTPLEKRSPPRDQEEMDQLFRLWTWRLNRMEQDELAHVWLQPEAS